MKVELKLSVIGFSITYRRDMDVFKGDIESVEVSVPYENGVYKTSIPLSKTPNIDLTKSTAEIIYNVLSCASNKRLTILKVELSKGVYSCLCKLKMEDKKDIIFTSVNKNDPAISTLVWTE